MLISAVSIALLAGCPLPELLSCIEPGDFSHEAVTLGVPETARLYSDPLPVISSTAFSHLVDTQPLLMEMSDEFDREVFAAFHHKVLAIRGWSAPKGLAIALRTLPHTDAVRDALAFEGPDVIQAANAAEMALAAQRGANV